MLPREVVSLQLVELFVLGKEEYSARTQNTVDIERHRKLEFRAGVLQHSGIILDQHIL